MTGPPAPLLVVDGLAVAFPRHDGPDFVALSGVSVTVRRGEALSVVGESGSGKTMLGVALLGLVPAPGRRIGGTIQLAGRDLTTLTEADWRRVRGRDIAMIFQDPMTSLNPVRSVGVQLSDALRRHDRSLPRGERTRRAVAILEAVAVPDARRRVHAYPHELSGGLRQRVLIAMALINNPSLIIADEVTTALDTTVQAQIVDLLQSRLTTAGLIMITHNLGVAARIGHRIAVMWAGRIIELGPAAEVVSRPAHPYTRRLLDAAPAFRKRGVAIGSLPGPAPARHDHGEGCSFLGRCPNAGARCGEAPVLTPAADHAVACHYPEFA